MNIIKLSAIDSTNDYLKINYSELIKKDIHIAYTFNQTNGKGQRGNSWVSEPEKNLAFSIIFFPNNFNIKNQFIINVIFSLFIFNTLKSLQIPDIKIKWPNDIMSGNKKICGILNELKIKGSKVEMIIIGFGLNINTNSGVFRINYANGIRKGQDIDLKLSKIHLSFSNIF